MMEEEDDNGKEGPTDSQRLLGDLPPSHYHSLPPSPRAGQYYQENSTMEPPKDKFNGVYLIFYVLGLGTLLPWNFFITANDYWLFKLKLPENTTEHATTVSPPVTSSRGMQNNSMQSPSSVTSAAFVPPDPHEENLNQLQVMFQSTLSVCAMVPNVIFQFLNTLLQQKVPEKARMMVSLTIMIVIFIVTEVLVKIDVSSWRLIFFLTTMISVVILNISSAIFQSSIFGIASHLPSKYIQALMAGQGMGGLFAACAMIVALSVSPNPISSAFAFFLTAIAVLILTMICYFLLQTNKFYLYHTSEATILSSTNAEKKPRTIRDNRNSDSEEIRKNGDAWINTDPLDDMKETNLFKDEVGFEKTSTVPPVFTIFKKIWIENVSVALIFFITLACYPAITSKVVSVSETPTTWSKTYFTPVTCFLLFNLTDWGGRTLSGYIHFPSQHSKYGILICSVARCVFPFLFAFCDAHPRTIPIVFNHDAYFIVFMILFGLSNGYFSTLAMQYGPKRVDIRHAATAGSMLAFSISTGLAAGAAFSFVIQTAICHPGASHC